MATTHTPDLLWMEGADVDALIDSLDTDEIADMLWVRFVAG